jgi:hypothetical protein
MFFVGLNFIVKKQKKIYVQRHYDDSTYEAFASIFVKTVKKFSERKYQSIIRVNCSIFTVVVKKYIGHLFTKL